MVELALLGGAAVTGVAGGAALLALYPWVPRDLGGAPDLDRRARRVRIPLADGDALDAWRLDGREPAAVLILHGYGRDHSRAWRYGAFLHAAGYSIVTFDFRSSRRRRRLPTTLGHHELPEAEAALAWMRGEPSLAGHRIGVLGESLGGAVAVCLAGRHDDVAALVADCPFAHAALALEDASQRWARLPRAAGRMMRVLGRAATGVDPGGLTPEAWATRLTTRPAFFIHALRDDRLSPEHARRLWRAAGAKDPLWLIPGAGHNEGWRRHPAEYARAVTAFYDRHLLGRGPGVPPGEHHRAPVAA
jgi:dipeptidyl aminopeptidase/acylaminoacyl peptidase